MALQESRTGVVKNTQDRRRSRPSASSPARRHASRARLLRGLAGVLGLMIIMEVVSSAGIVSPQFLPPFSVILVRAVEIFALPTFQLDLVATISSFVLGLVIATVLGVVLGVIFGLSDTVYQISRSVVELIRPVPPVALIPLFVLVFGNGIQMKLVVVVFAAIWPILFNAMYGVHGIDPLTKEMAYSFHKSRWQVLRQVIVPGAAPLIATGVRISSSIVLVVVITVELVAGGAQGVGAFIASAQATGTDVKDVYAGILVAGVLGLVINLLMGAAERHWFGWNTTSKEG